jgi:hypothetical protein
MPCLLKEVKLIMMSSILAALLLAAAAKAIVIPESNGNDAAGLTNHQPQIETSIRLQGNGVLRIPVYRTSRMSSNDRKRQLFDPLRNDISGYSIQRKSSLPPALLLLTPLSFYRNLCWNSSIDSGSSGRYWVF